MSHHVPALPNTTISPPFALSPQSFSSINKSSPLATTNDIPRERAIGDITVAVEHERPKKKPAARKGWKGWALVVEDEQGNVIEELEGGTARHGSTAIAENTISREGSANVQLTDKSRGQPQPSVSSVVTHKPERKLLLLICLSSSQ
ncbi:hypothetical protein M231_02092 [Tremella mesenterica]|uniref:Uncharacterized protein n=1 Tax=Tremella mesenterica TaxID=5217 RepID=A0A4Q1BRN9_TREME|nr:hypothetical protein M231_02092 [Tremella mesenterica]